MSNALIRRFKLCPAALELFAAWDALIHEQPESREEINAAWWNYQRHIETCGECNRPQD
jgi:hypothetical protein